jgi:hypothetical protein
VKRLLEETSDGFERSLLRAGSDVQPDGVHKRRLLAALAAGTLAATAGGSVGYAATSPWWKVLVASNIGKATLLSLVVAGSGTAWLVLREPGARHDVSRSEGASSPTARSDAPADDLRLLHAPSATIPVSDLGSVTNDPAHPTVLAPVASQATAVTSGAPARVPSRVSKPDRREKSAPSAASSAATSASGPSALVLEARLVERLRQAISAGEGSTVQALVSEYRRDFPEGQLRPEVSKLETQWRAR